MKMRATITSDGVKISVEHDGASHKVLVRRDTLEDLDRVESHASLEAVSSSFERHRQLIAQRAAATLAAGRRGDGNGVLVLGLADFPEA